MKRNWYKYLFIIITFFVIGFIWWNSSKNGEESSGISQGVLYEIMQIFARIGISTDITEHIIRKLAHFTEFTALGILLSIDTVLFLKNMKQYVWIPLFIGLLVALIDETIQLFPIGRSSSVKDVWIDFSGVIFGTILLLVLKQIYLFKLRNHPSLLSTIEKSSLNLRGKLPSLFCKRRNISNILFIRFSHSGCLRPCSLS